VPYGRLELRLPDSSCNPYLATAAVLAAGMDGVDRQLDPGQPSNFNHYRLSEEETRRVGIGILPQNLGAALMALDDDPLFREQLGAEFIDEFLSVKTMEWVDYQRHVSEWEVDRYLEFF
jgi:glutamine synthetase